MTSAIFVDAKHRKIEKVEIEGHGAQALAGMRALVGGWICLAHYWHETGDHLYVDDEGLLKEDLVDGFVLKFYPRWLAGNGVLLGQEYETEDGYSNRPPKISIAKLEPLIHFMKRPFSGEA